MSVQNKHFVFLNRDGLWPDFQTNGLDRSEDGALTLSVLPLAPTSFVQPSSPNPAPAAPSGIVVASDGRVFFSDTEGDRVFSIDPCDSTIAAVPLRNEEGSAPAGLNAPRGLAIHTQLNALLVADSQYQEIKLFSLDTYRLTDIWKKYDKDSSFEQPQSVATDSQGHTYVVDVGAKRVFKLDRQGNKLKFWKKAKTAWGAEEADEAKPEPSEVSVFEFEDKIEVHVLDSSQSTLFVFDPHGSLQEKINLKTLFEVQEPVGIVATKTAFYVGDNRRKRIVKLKRLANGEQSAVLKGEVREYTGYVSAMGSDSRRDDIWAHPGGQVPPVKIDLKGAFVNNGIFWTGPINVSDRETVWHRLKALGKPVDDGAHFRFFVFTSNEKTNRPAYPTPEQRNFQTDSSQLNSWKEFPADLDDLLIGETSKFLWIGGKLEGDDFHSPRIEQIRVDYDHRSYAEFLPEIFQSEPQSNSALDRFLSLFESFFTDVESEIKDVDRRFDPNAVPAEWLQWLADWLGLELREDWTETKKRKAIAHAFELYAWRGTAIGLRKALKFYADVDARIEEPLLNADWWVLPAQDESNASAKSYSILGLNTRLVAAEPQGAVVGTSATLDHSHLIRQEEFGSPLFDELANRFSVHVFESQVKTDEKLNEVREIIEREKPAHTAYQLCVRNGMRIGVQSTIGIDAMVTEKQPPERRLGKDFKLG